jgi:uncharacterized protein
MEILKSQTQPLHTEKNNADGSKKPWEWKRNTAKISRWLHIYISMVSFALLFFFAVTGLTLNHPDTFAGPLRTISEKGRMETDWVKTKDTLRIPQLKIVEYLRSHHGIKAAVSEFRIDETQCTVSFKGPGFAADAFIDRETGTYDIEILRAGFIGILNDLHKGRDTGSGWSVLIDASAILMILVSLSGLILMLFLNKKRQAGVLVAVLGLLLSFFVYVFWSR